MVQIVADYFLGYFRRIRFSGIDGKSAEFAKISARESFMPHGIFMTEAVLTSTTKVQVQQSN